MRTATPDPDRLLALLPLVHRMRDEAKGHPLRDLLRVIAEQVEVVQVDIDRLYDNWFVETADDWAVPYLADLVGWTPVPEAGVLATSASERDLARNSVLVPRQDVANTIRHRRRKGTRALLDELARDVAGWPGLAVEFARLLWYLQPVNHLQPARGQTTDVRDTAALELVDTPFDALARTIDVRRISSRRTPGRHNLPSVGLFVWRLRSYPVTRTPAGLVERVGRWAFTFDALGFDVPLFTAPAPPERRDHPAGPLDVPRPIGRRHFEVTSDDGHRQVAPGYYGPRRSLTVWAPDWPERGEGRPVPVSRVIPADLGQWDTYRPRPGTVAVDPVRGRLIFPRRDPPKRVHVSYHYGFSADLGGGEYDRRVRELAPGPPGEARWYRTAEGTRTFRRALEDWSHDRPDRAVIELVDSDLYSAPVDVTLAAGQSLVIRAANRIRPVLWLADRRGDRPDSFSARLAAGATLVLDGLIVAGRAVHLSGGDPEPPVPEEDDDEIEPADTSHAAAVEKGDFAGNHEDVTAEGPSGESATEECAAPARVVLRHCTLVPGWLPMDGCETEAPPPPALELVGLDGARVEISHSIVGTIQVLGDRHESDPVRLEVSDSILDSSIPGLEALGGSGPGAAYAIVRIVRTTVFGHVHVHAMELGEDSIFEGVVTVMRRGNGCLRFSSVTPGSRTPRRFHCQPDLAVEALGPPGTVDSARQEEAWRRVRPRFTSIHYPDPGYAQLSCQCPDEIRRGAQDQSEMGVFHDLYQPAREAALQVRADEYTPAGMDVAVIPVT